MHSFKKNFLICRSKQCPCMIPSPIILCIRTQMEFQVTSGGKPVAIEFHFLLLFSLLLYFFIDSILLWCVCTQCVMNNTLFLIEVLNLMLHKFYNIIKFQTLHCFWRLIFNFLKELLTICRMWPLSSSKNNHVAL